LQSISCSIEGTSVKKAAGKPVRKTGHSRLFEIARLLVYLDQIARIIINANHSIM
jgi:hypothetical protein